MKKIPFYSTSLQMMVVDMLCLCGGRWTHHLHDHERVEIHGGGHPATGCPQFRYAGYMYEEAKGDPMPLRPGPATKEQKLVQQ